MATHSAIQLNPAKVVTGKCSYRHRNPETFKDTKKCLFWRPSQSDSKATLLKSDSKVAFFTVLVTFESLLSSFARGPESHF